MSLEEVLDVCRLCLKNENLVWVFDKRFESTENMKDVILITTGVEIDLNDVVSQKICKKCLQIAIKIFQFRGTSLKNDTLLKNKYKELTKDSIVKIPAPCINAESSHHQTDSKPFQKRFNSFHPSVENIMKKYPKITLPKTCLYINIAPFVAMPMNEVENYFVKRNLNMQKYILYALEAVRSEKKSSDIKVKTESKLSLKTSQDEHKDLKEFKTVSSVDSKPASIDKTECNIVKTDKDKPDIKRKFVTSGSIPDGDGPSTSKIKRISESNIGSEKKENTKPSVISSLGLSASPKKSKPYPEEPVQVSYVERTLEICNICNSVQYSLKDLKRHQLKHLRCQFCKSKFKTMERKVEHIREECIVKKTMYSLPDINLTKIECDLAVRQKYPNAFISFPSIPGMEKKDSSSKDKTDNDNLDTKTSTEQITAEKTAKTIINDVIEILSDDDDEPRVTTTKNIEETEEPVKLPNTSVVESGSTVSPAVPLTTTIDPVPQTALPASSANTSEHPPVAQNVDQPTLSSSIVKPDIKIKNNYILDTIDPKSTDMMVLKELLKSYRKVQLTKDAASQSELPSTTSIIRNGLTTTLKDLKHQLQIYRIPVEIKHGVYKVTFDYNPKQKKSRKMADWNNLRPVDLKKRINKNIIPKMNNNHVHSPMVSSNPSNTTHTLSAPSLAHGIPVTNPSYSSSIDLTSTSNSMSNISNQNPSYSSTIDLTSTSNSVSNISNQTPTISYNTNNAILAQFVYQTNPSSSSVIMNQPNNFVSYNPTNNLYNTGTSVMIPNSVPQVLVSSTPVFASNSVFQPNTVGSLSVIPATTSLVLSSQSSSTSGISSMSKSSVSYSNSSTPLQTSDNTSTIYATPVLTTNNLNDISCGSNSLGKNVLGNLNKETTVSSGSSSTGMPVTTTTMPLIRVKDLLSLK